MSIELNEIICHSVFNIKKFKWANCHQVARLIALTKPNILSIWNGAGLFPFNPQKVIHWLRSRPEALAEPLLAATNTTTVVTWSNRSNRFSLISTTPSQLDSITLHSTNKAVLNNIYVCIFDTLTEVYMPKLVALIGHLYAANIIVQHNYKTLNIIMKRRREMA
jgi:hypothetical protein